MKFHAFSDQMLLTLMNVKQLSSKEKKNSLLYNHPTLLRHTNNVKNDSEKEKLLRELDAKHAKQAADRAAQTANLKRDSVEKKLQTTRSNLDVQLLEEQCMHQQLSGIE